MANLSTLTYTASVNAYTTNYPTEFLVYNTSISTPTNGGRCCLWTAPAGTTWVRFEMWGAGGSGAASCCCMMGMGGGAGGYAMRTVCSSSLAGCQYTICAASSSYPSYSGGNGCQGDTSWASGYGLSNFCAVGGAYGCSQCFMYGVCYICQIMCCCASSYGGDINIPGYTGSQINTQFCYYKGESFAGMAPATGSGPWVGPGCFPIGGYTSYTQPYFPGGGGWSAHVSSGVCCCGQYGAGGLVSVTYG